MKVSDLLLELQEFYQLHGDLEVMVRTETHPRIGTLRLIYTDPALSLLEASEYRAIPVCVVEL